MSNAPDPLPARPTGTGNLSEQVRRLWAALGRQRILRGVGYTVTESPAGTTISIPPTATQQTTQTTSDGGVWI